MIAFTLLAGVIATGTLLGDGILLGDGVTIDDGAGLDPHGGKLATDAGVRIDPEGRQ